MPLSPLAHHFYTMACNNAWANHRLLAACSRLSQADFVAPRTSFFPSLMATLNHNLTVDWYYVDALERAVHGKAPNTEPDRFFTPETPFATCAELAAAQRAVDRRLIDACSALTDDRLTLPVPVMRRAGLQNESATRLLAHLFQHQIHHRGQAHAMLPEQRSSHRNSTSSSARTRPTCARRSSPSSGFPRRRSGACLPSDEWGTCSGRACCCPPCPSTSSHGQSRLRVRRNRSR
jgi:uncharacterized damage-inducible protein DinB